MSDRYIIGTAPIPPWLNNLLMPYRRMDGRTGWEFYGERNTFQLFPGDELIWENKRIIVKERVRRI